jgi:enamine deaminase RidA (YjgF/YER057c/UK114 family)
MEFISNSDGDLTFLTWTPDSESGSTTDMVRHAYQEITALLGNRRWVLLHERIYGDLNAADSILSERRATLGDLGAEAAVPPTFVEGAPCNGAEIAGVHAIAARSDRGESGLLEWNSQVCGRMVKGKDASYLYLSDLSRLIPNRSGLTAVEETRKTFELVEQVLGRARWSFPDVCRTWFYLHSILDWYDDFNKIRNRAFTDHGLFSESCPTPIPASTGVYGRNLGRSWCTLDLLAIRARQGSKLDVQRLSNPQQNEAPEYGSAFSRGLCVTTESCRYVFVSGTASIDDHGASVHFGDFERQTEQTIDTVSSLLAAAGAGLDDICQATSFIKHRSDVPSYEKIVDRLGLGNLPVICTIGDVCRSELLFELDATAILPPE